MIKLLLFLIPILSFAQTYEPVLYLNRRFRVIPGYTFPVADGSANQVLTTDGAGAVTFQTAGFKQGNETFFWSGPTVSVAGGADIPIFTTTPDRTNSDLGSSADITLRISDTQLEVVNTGLHNVSISIMSSGTSDDLEMKINGAIWVVNHFGAMTFSLNYFFTAGDDITITRQGGGNRTMSDISVSVTRVNE